MKREIFAGDFCDRVIHHYVFSYLYPHYNKLFITDCYSCRQNKGTSYGIQRVSKFIKQASANYQTPVYLMKLDIAGYFMNINKHKLYNMNKYLIRQIFQGDDKTINELLYLLKKIIYNDPRQNCKIKGKKEDWQGLPKNKSLFFTPANKGLPIGNLTSQLFGNLYLNDFDHYVKEKLKCRYYGRYVDDLVFIHQDKDFLLKLIPQIQHYLQSKLGLSLHPKKIYLQNMDKGVPFLGMIIKPHCIYPGKRIRRNFYQALKETSLGKRNLDSINSYLGLIKNYNSYKLRKKYFDSELGQKVLKTLNAEINSDYTKLKKSSFPKPPFLS